jgi:hypothetical protein
MKLLLLVYTGARPEHVTDILGAHDARAFTEIDRAHGRGATGRVEGTRAWPGETSVLFTIVDEERVGGLQLALRAFGDSALPGERLHVAVLPVETFF